jgi:hypothetical protein
MAEFQTQVNTMQAPAVEGDWASANPRKSVLAGEGALVAGRGVIDGLLVAGIVAGRFGWTTFETIDNDGAPGTVNTFGTGLPAGFVHRNQQGIITGWLQTASMVVPTGLQTALFNDVDIWIKNRGAAPAQYGMKAFANFADGSCSFAAAGAAAPGAASGSASSIAAATFAATGSISDNLLTVSAVASGLLYPGASFTGTNVAAGTQIVSQITPLKAGETLNGVGRYRVNMPGQVVASTALSGTYGVLTVGGTVAGTFVQGASLSGTNVVAGTFVGQQLTGTPGGAGTYVVSNNTVVASTAITAASGIETKWYAKSSGLVGDIIKLSNTL